MFVESFENSNRQQARRASRMEALRRMEEAAAGLVHAETTADGKRKGSNARGTNGRSEMNGRNDAFGGDMLGETAKASNAGRREAMPVSNPKPVGQGTSEGSFVGDFPTGARDKTHPWNARNDEEEESHDDYSFGPVSVGHPGGHGQSGSASVSSAREFLRETQRQHELEHSPGHANSNIIGNAHASAYESRAPPPLTASGRLKLSSAAKQFLWDDNSVASGFSKRTNNRSHQPNLHDIKHSLSQQTGISRNKGQGKRGARWSAINNANDDLRGLGEGIWNALTGSGNNNDHHSVASSRSSRSYRDAEGERLLNLASERLSHSPGGYPGGRPVVENLGALDEEAKEYGEIEDDDSFVHGQGREAGSGRVFLDREGNMSYDHENYNADEPGELHTRRMRNSYKRGLKRPAALLCAAAAIVGVCFGAVEVYSRVTKNMAAAAQWEQEMEGWNATYDAWTDWAERPDSHLDLPVAGKGGDAKQEDGTEVHDTEAPPNGPPDNVAVDKTRLDHLRYKLINGGFSTPAFLQDENSAEYAALLWLARDDPRKMDPESVYLPQRFGLAVLWFGTIGGGYGWHLPGQADEDAGYDDAYDDAYHDDGYDDYEDDGSRGLKDVPPALWTRHDAWMSGAGICGWYGVKCHPRENDDVHDPNNDGDVSHLELRGNNLQGLIPEEIYTTLPYLKVLDLSDNGLAGTLSDDIAKLTHLESLNLTANDVAGSLTAAIGDVTSLKDLYLANNILGDSIPRSIGKLQKLRHLDLSGNSLKGTLPYQLGSLKQLSSLDLSYNLLAGPIPHEFSDLQTLVELDVSHNDLGGPLFSELGDVTYLTLLRLNDNHFDGQVPTEIGKLIHLDELRLDNNDFDGSLPKEIAHLEGLDILNVANNKFRGEFPPEWTEMAGLRELDVSSNELQGGIPIFVDGMTNLRSLNMAHNDLTGSIPSELASLYKLEYLYLDNNEFEGKVPEKLGDLANLKKLALHNNYLIGDVGERICKLADELFLTQLSVDCGGETPEVYCDCCICHDHEPIVHLVEEP